MEKAGGKAERLIYDDKKPAYRTEVWIRLWPASRMP